MKRRRLALLLLVLAAFFAWRLGDELATPNATASSSPVDWGNFDLPPLRFETFDELASTVVPPDTRPSSPTPQTAAAPPATLPPAMHAAVLAALPSPPVPESGSIDTDRAHRQLTAVDLTLIKRSVSPEPGLEAIRAAVRRVAYHSGSVLVFDSSARSSTGARFIVSVNSALDITAEVIAMLRVSAQQTPVAQ